MKSLIFVVLFLAFPLFVSAQSMGVGTGTGTGWNPNVLDSTGLPGGSIYDIINKFLFWLLAIFGSLAVIGFVISGIMYLVSVGNDDMIKKAKSYMTYCIVGVVVALSGLVIIYAISSALSGAGTAF